MKRTILTLAAIGFSTAAFSADLLHRKPVPAPVEASAACLEKNSLPSDAFGFNGGSDVNDLGALSMSGTYGGAFGVRSGSLDAHTGTIQMTYSPLPCLETDPFVFGGATNSKVFGVSSRGSQFGGGVEFKYKLLGRDTHGVGLAVDAVFQGAATNGAFYTVVGRSRDVYDSVFSVFLDKELVAGKLYGALNLSYDFNWQDLGTPRNGYANTSVGRIGAALSYQVVEGFFLGVEASHFRRYDNLAFGNQLGQATFVGPNFYWAFAKGWALSGSWNTQVAGKAAGSRNDLDLTNFSHHIAKVKLNHDF